ncbi:fibroleukin [Galendromus occidentalis]|uniref:Fibroleukin n=1 Tax=Galendromus occidentalis TaxID=34638 RepID=A0AAJ7L5E4_9ACAR|nr:fibroleukin [Galendromus occidentalis]
MYRVCSLVLLLGAAASTAAPECARTDSVLEARDEIIEVVQSTAQSMVQMMIVMERIEEKVEKLSNDLKAHAPPSHQTHVAPKNDVMDNRLRSLESSVSSLHRRLDEKLDVVVSVENKREEQEKIFTDILKKILNTVNTVYERIHSDAKGKSSSGPAPGVHRPASDQQQTLLIQDSLDSLSREFREKLDVLQSKLVNSIEEVNLYTRMGHEKVNYISENMVHNEDVQRIGENNPKIVDTDKVLEVVKEEINRCTRAIVNAPVLTKAAPNPADNSRSLASQNVTATVSELAFYVGPKRDDCKMTAAIKVPHNCDQLGQAGANCDGPYMVYDSNGKKPMKVVCDMSGGGWTLLLRRGKGKPLSFDRTWSSYKHGFGNIAEEFYIGNEYMHILTEKPKLLRIELEAFSGEKLTLDYANFSVGPENDSYRMRVGNYLGNNMRVGNAFRRHNDKQFLTKDRVVGSPNSHQCPHDHKAGHWWHSCYSVLLTGEYATPETANSKNGIRWPTWKTEPLKSVILKIKEMS